MRHARLLFEFLVLLCKLAVLVARDPQGNFDLLLACSALALARLRNFAFLLTSLPLAFGAAKAVLLRSRPFGRSVLSRFDLSAVVLPGLLQVGSFPVLGGVCALSSGVLLARDNLMRGVCSSSLSSASSIMLSA